ncbi:uncharacterized protein C8Q71DRAFT_705248 [Rhodofomes roseus]|uniref:Uncharacterized protein n=1 Tax=Rhodofomes roseus TaxID=34475 RepID=A0ABQ8KJW8_9APHY|nr:uncharacterized protein C8Q71DRAFT_705248 [Rhodofomes roseus]KAH9838417.1 hypothetical protein C8Q71DRAFT_705248 [Rhodofomes roseus]
MASTTAVVPAIPHDRPSAVRTNSITSTASSGGASLRRRSATRSRSVLSQVKRGKSQGPPGDRKNTVDDDAHSILNFGDPLPPVPAMLYAEPEELASVLPQSAPAAQHRPRTAGSQHRAQGATREAGTRSLTADAGTVEAAKKPWETRSEGGSIRGVPRSRALSLPRQAFRANISSDSSPEPSPQTPGQEMKPFLQMRTGNPGYRNPRDSMLSTSSSSLYPASTATGTFTESSFPYSIDDDLEERLRPVVPEIFSADKPEFDGDDVSYRLRLLVNNSYFLPPAHAKPSPLSLNPQNAAGQKVSPKPSATFLDFFRLGKSKSKPTTPYTTSPPAVDQPGPILRTTSDSTTASGFILRPHARSLPQTPVYTIPAPSTSRVVVVRERMDDLAAAAKEAEQDLRTRAVRKTRSQSIIRPQPSHLDVIDPTDAVDLPPPSSGYPFTVQASAVYGVNVSGALGAAVLAEQLPPHSPGAWSSSTEDDAWRKALLAEAVHHSLNNSVDTSFASGFTDRSALTSPTGPSRSGSSGHTSQPSDAFSSGTQFRSMIGQRILENLYVATEADEPQSPTTPTQARAPSSANSQTTFSSVSSFAGQRSPRHDPCSPPIRVESPTRTAALPPPPRKPMINPTFSHSQPDLTDPDIEPARPSLQALRKVMSSPGLSESREAFETAGFRAASPMSISQRLSMRISPVMLNAEAIPSQSSYRSFMSQLSSHSRVSDDLSYVTPEDTDVDQTLQNRPSVTVSMVTEGRPSITTSEYSVPSPTASAFHDAIFGSIRSPSSLSRRSYLPEGSGTSRSVSPVSPTVSAEFPYGHAPLPPPRISVSSLVPTALAPPPRSSPRASPKLPPSPLRPTAEAHPSPPADRPFSIRSIGSGSIPETSPESAAFPSPSSPRSLADRRGHASPLALRIPEEFLPPTIHSAPGPASPADFFDKIESTMDELESTEGSEDEDEEEEEEEEEKEEKEALSPPRPPFSHSRSDSQQTMRSASATSSKSSIMRLGNYSTPSLRPPTLRQEEPAQLSDVDRKKPISNVPVRPRRRSFFSSKKKGLKNIDIPLLPFRDINTSQGEGGSDLTPEYEPRRRRATADAEQKPRLPKRESMLQFEGMLDQYAQAERERIKRITTSVSGSQR